MPQTRQDNERFERRGRNAAARALINKIKKISYAAAVCEDAGLEVIEAAPDGGYAAVLGHVVGMDTRFFSDEEIHRVHELPHWKDLDNLHHKVSYHLSTKLVARKPPSN